MRKNSLVLILGILVGWTILSTSCNQGVADSVSVAALTAVAVDETQAALMSDDIDNEVQIYVSDSILSLYKNSDRTHAVTLVVTGGPTITIDKPDSIYPKTFTLDYGSGTIIANGNILKGKITAVVNTFMKLKNSTRSITLNGFSENGTAMKGSKVITYGGINSADFSYWNVNNKDTIAHTDGSSVLWNSDRQRVLVSDNATPRMPSDDIYIISGSSTGVDSRGTAFSLVIRNNYPLIIGGNWPFYVKGITSLSIKNGTVVIDYGNLTVDKDVTLLVNGEISSYTFSN